MMGRSRLLEQFFDGTIAQHHGCGNDPHDPEHFLQDRFSHRGIDLGGHFLDRQISSLLGDVLNLLVGQDWRSTAIRTIVVLLFHITCPFSWQSWPIP